MDTYIVQILDDSGEVIRSESVDVHDLGLDGIIRDARREFAIQSDQYLKVINPYGDVVYNDYYEYEYPSREEIYEEEYLESLKYYPDDSEVI